MSEFIFSRCYVDGGPDVLFGQRCVDQLPWDQIFIVPPIGAAEPPLARALPSRLDTPPPGADARETAAPRDLVEGDA